MSSCLDEGRVPAVAGGEGTREELAHASSCERCRQRVDTAAAQMREFAQQMAALPVPPRLGARVASEQRSGATTLRDGPQSRRPRAWVFASAAAAVLVLVFVLFPSVDPRTRLNAAEILGRSLQTFSASGVELMEYELTITAPSSLALESGTYRIEQLIDHNTGRWRFARFAPDGSLMNGIGEDPATGMREAVVRFEGRTYAFRFKVAHGEYVPLWDLERRYAESMLRVVQASAGHVVTEEGTGSDRRYVVELPETAAAPTSALFDLNHARVVVDATNYHVIAFNARGAIMGERVAVGFRLIQRTVGQFAQPTGGFDLLQDRTDVIVLEGEGSGHPPGDMLALLLRSAVR